MQLIKPLLWGLCALLCAALLLGGGYGTFFHAISLRDVAETTNKAREISAEANALADSIQKSFNEKQTLERLSDFAGALKAEYAISQHEMELFRLLNHNFCGDGWRSGCAFFRYDRRYEELESIYLKGRQDKNPPMDEQLSAYWWAADVHDFIERQQDSERVTYENSQRIDSLLGALSVLLIATYLSMALIRFKHLSVGDYSAVAGILFLPLSWSIYFATNYMDPTVGLTRNILVADDLGMMLFYGSFAYPFLVAPPIYMYITKTGRSFFSLLRLRSESNAKN
jgi:hypothetical protein